MLDVIQNRRSIRKYTADEVPRAAIEEILKAGMSAPSSKNRQPWRFVVVTGNAKAEALCAMERGLAREKIYPVLPESVPYLGGAENTYRIMQSAPVLIFIINTLATALTEALSVEARVSEICNMQSIGAAIENMTLEATAQGLGSLWICDIFFAYRELCDWLSADGQLCAALAVGYPSEVPAPRPRNPLVVEWRN